jgi:hypothetical protein
MKKINSLIPSLLLGALVTLFATSCTTTRNGVAVSHFHDDAMVNAVLQFSSWDYTFLVRPRYEENGFLQQVRPENIRQVLNQLNVRRGTAAVVLGWTCNGPVLDKTVADWKTLLGQCGFQRVVFLRAQDGNRLNGSEVIDDSILQLSSAKGAS